MASLEPALNRQNRLALTAFKAALGVTLNRLGTATARRSKHARVVALRVRDALAETCEVATGLAAVSGGGGSGSGGMGSGGLGSGVGGGGGGGNSSMEKAKAKVAQRIKQLKSRLWLTLHASRHAVTRGTWEACLTQVVKRLDAALTAHYNMHHAKLARAKDGGGDISGSGIGAGDDKMADESCSDSNSSNLGAAVTLGALLTPAATTAVAAVPPTEVEAAPSSSSSSMVPASSLPVPRGLFRTPQEGEPQRLTVPLLVRRRLKPGDLVKVLWSDESDDNDDGAPAAGAGQTGTGAGAGGSEGVGGDGASSAASNSSVSMAVGSSKRPSAESESNDEAGPGGALPPLDDPNWYCAAVCCLCG